MKRPVTDYSKFRLHKINEPEFRHLKYLLFWPVYLFTFIALERLFVKSYYHPVHCVLDDMIPFCEFFLIPYFLWFFGFVFITLYTLLYDIEEFKRFMRFLCISFMGTLVFYMICPTCQELRVPEFTRDNILTRIVSWLYSFDTNTNVCPSLHVIGALGMCFSAWHARGLEHPAIKVLAFVLAVLISLSTVFLKQHSIIDVITAVPVSLLVYWIVYRLWK